MINKIRTILAFLAISFVGVAGANDAVKDSWFTGIAYYDKSTDSSNNEDFWNYGVDASLTFPAPNTEKIGVTLDGFRQKSQTDSNLDKNDTTFSSIGAGLFARDSSFGGVGVHLSRSKTDFDATIKLNPPIKISDNQYTTHEELQAEYYFTDVTVGAYYRHDDSDNSSSFSTRELGGIWYPTDHLRLSAGISRVDLGRDKSTDYSTQLVWQPEFANLRVNLAYLVAPEIPL